MYKQKLTDADNSRFEGTLSEVQHLVSIVRSAHDRAADLTREGDRDKAKFIIKEMELLRVRVETLVGQFDIYLNYTIDRSGKSNA